MNLYFEPNKRENTVNIFQCTATTKRRIAYYDKDKDKVIALPDVKKELESKGIDLKQYCTDMLGAYQEWERSNSPLRNLSKEQLEGVITSIGNVNVLCVCLQDEIAKLSVLNDLDYFNEMSPDLLKLKEALLNMSNKMLRIVGKDSYYETTEVADEIMALLKEKASNLLIKAV